VIPDFFSSLFLLIITIYVQYNTAMPLIFETGKTLLKPARQARESIADDEINNGDEL
jgi:hypothetical protein